MGNFHQHTSCIALLQDSCKLVDQFAQAVAFIRQWDGATQLCVSKCTLTCDELVRAQNHAEQHHRVSPAVRGKIKIKFRADGEVQFGTQRVEQHIDLIAQQDTLRCEQLQGFNDLVLICQESLVAS